MCIPGWGCDIAKILTEGVRLGFTGIPAPEHRYPQRHEPNEPEGFAIAAKLDSYFPKGIIEGAWTVLKKVAIW